MSTKKVRVRNVNKSDLPEIIKKEFGVEENITRGLMETATLGGKMLMNNEEPKVFLPEEAPKDLDVSFVKAGEESGIEDELGTPVKMSHNINVVGVRVEKPGKFRFLLNHTLDEVRNDKKWTLNGEVEKS